MGVLNMAERDISYWGQDWSQNKMADISQTTLTHWSLGNLNEILRHVIFKQILVIDGWGISCEIALIWMSLDLPDDQSTLVQIMAWCRQATSHYLSQCWPRSLSPYGITRPQWVNIYRLIFLIENCYILVEISLTFVPKDPIDNKSALVQVMASCQEDD